MVSDKRYQTIKKYLCSCKRTLQEKHHLQKRQEELVTSGWISNKNEWIPVKSFHAHPEYLNKLNPLLIYDQQMDPELLLRFKTKGEEFYEQLNAQMFDCISSGAVRTIQKGSTLYLDSNNTERGVSAIKILSSLVDISKFISIYLNILDQRGNIIRLLEYCKENNNFRPQTNNPLMFEPSLYYL